MHNHEISSTRGELRFAHSKDTPSLCADNEKAGPLTRTGLRIVVYRNAAMI